MPSTGACWIPPDGRCASTSCFTLLGLLVKLAGDLAYSLVDPRIDFAARKQ